MYMLLRLPLKFPLASTLDCAVGRWQTMLPSVLPVETSAAMALLDFQIWPPDFSRGQAVAPRILLITLMERIVGPAALDRP